MLRIVRLAELTPGEPVVEIGAGLGSLTLGLAEAGAAVTAVEIDRHVVPALREATADQPVTVVQGDALDLDWDAVLAAHPVWSLVANLPYNVATPLVCSLLDDVPTHPAHAGHGAARGGGATGRAARHAGPTASPR